MKKLLFLFSLLVVTLTTQAQESATQDWSMGYNDTYVSYVMPTASNATTATDSVWYYTVLKESKMPLRYDVKISLDSVSGTYKTVPVVLRGKKWLSDSWTTLSTVYWVTGVDTVKTFTQATPGQYRYYGIYLRSTTKGFVFRIPELSFKFWEQ